MRMESNSGSWSCAVRMDGLAVFYTGASPRDGLVHTLDGGRGVIFGTIFSGTHENSAIGPIVDRTSTDRIIGSRGRDLISDYWGDYVAIFCDNSGVAHVVRGPATRLPCLRLSESGIDLLCSWVGDALAISSRSFALDWDYLTAHVVDPVIGSRTAIDNITELACGMRLTRSSTTSEATLWSPFEVAAQSPIEDAAAALAALNNATRQSVRAWGSQHKRILLYLSGGLDSSIVLGCLRQTLPDLSIVCVTEHSPGVNTDERVFAEIAATQAGCELVARERTSNFDMSALLQSVVAVRPEANVRRAELSQFEAQMAKRHGASAVFTGVGGDEVFCGGDARFCAADFLHHHSPRPEFISIAANVAQSEGITVWKALRTARRWEAMKHPEMPISVACASRSLVTTETLERARLFKKQHDSFASFERSDDYALGKLWQIYSILQGGYFYDPLCPDGAPPQIEPLLSQPILDVCLRTPSYVMLPGARDRALARRAFADILPSVIARRFSKGGIEEHSRAALHHNQAFVKEFLLDGRLASKGILDRVRLEEALCGASIKALNVSSELFHYLAVESWIRVLESEFDRRPLHSGAPAYAATG